MTEDAPIYATAKPGLSAANDYPRKIGVGRALAHGHDAGRRNQGERVMSDQSCPFEEEFDGNDFCATHLIGYMGHEPAACIRARFFADFCKLERLAAEPSIARPGSLFKRFAPASSLPARKASGAFMVSADRPVNFWAHFGAKLGPNR
jgi:hypothetical protein